MTIPTCDLHKRYAHSCVRTPIQTNNQTPARDTTTLSAKLHKCPFPPNFCPMKFTRDLDLASDITISSRELAGLVRGCPLCLCCGDSQSDMLESIYCSMGNVANISEHYNVVLSRSANCSIDIKNVEADDRKNRELTFTTIIAITPMTMRKRKNIMHLSVAT